MKSPDYVATTLPLPLPDITIWRRLDKPLAAALAMFFKGLYDKELLNLTVLKAVIGEIDEHHKKFTEVNNQGNLPLLRHRRHQGYLP